MLLLLLEVLILTVLAKDLVLWVELLSCSIKLFSGSSSSQYTMCVGGMRWWREGGGLWEILGGGGGMVGEEGGDENGGIDHCYELRILVITLLIDGFATGTNGNGDRSADGVPLLDLELNIANWATDFFCRSCCSWFRTLKSIMELIGVLEWEMD